MPLVRVSNGGTKGFDLPEKSALCIRDTAAPYVTDFSSSNSLALGGHAWLINVKPYSYVSANSSWAGYYYGIDSNGVATQIKANGSIANYDYMTVTDSTRTLTFS